MVWDAAGEHWGAGGVGEYTAHAYAALTALAEQLDTVDCPLPVRPEAVWLAIPVMPHTVVPMNEVPPLCGCG